MRATTWPAFTMSPSSTRVPRRGRQTWCRCRFRRLRAGHCSRRCLVAAGLGLLPPIVSAARGESDRNDGKRDPGPPSPPGHWSGDGQGRDGRLVQLGGRLGHDLGTTGRGIPRCLALPFGFLDQMSSPRDADEPQGLMPNSSDIVVDLHQIELRRTRAKGRLTSQCAGLVQRQRLVCMAACTLSAASARPRAGPLRAAALHRRRPARKIFVIRRRRLELDQPSAFDDGIRNCRFSMGFWRTNRISRPRLRWIKDQPVCVHEKTALPSTRICCPAGRKWCFRCNAGTLTVSAP